jgi:sterol 3beta-glucosyltransferase
VCVAFGSTVTRHREKLTRIVLEALAISRWRGVLVGTRRPVEVVSDDVLGLDYAPYSWLFPRMAGVVHHGGAGTTGKGLRAGIPNAVVPFTSDQPFWGRRVHELGAGPEPIPAPRISAKRLAEAIGAVTNDGDMRRRAELIGEAIRAEDGVGEAIGIIGRYLDVKQAGG